MVHTLHAWRSEDNEWESALAFFHVGHGDQAQSIGIGSEQLYFLDPHASPPGLLA